MSDYKPTGALITSSLHHFEHSLTFSSEHDGKRQDGQPDGRVGTGRTYFLVSNLSSPANITQSSPRARLTHTRLATRVENLPVFQVAVTPLAPPAATTTSQLSTMVYARTVSQMVVSRETKLQV